MIKPRQIYRPLSPHSFGDPHIVTAITGNEVTLENLVNGRVRTIPADRLHVTHPAEPQRTDWVLEEKR